MVLKCVLLVNINVTKMYENCGSFNIQVACNVILRSAIKTCDQMHQVLKNVLATSWNTYKKMHVYTSSMQAEYILSCVLIC